MTARITAKIAMIDAHESPILSEIYGTPLPKPMFGDIRFADAGNAVETMAGSAHPSVRRFSAGHAGAQGSCRTI